MVPRFEMESERFQHMVQEGASGNEGAAGMTLACVVEHRRNHGSRLKVGEKHEAGMEKCSQGGVVGKRSRQAIVKIKV